MSTSKPIPGVACGSFRVNEGPVYLVTRPGGSDTLSVWLIGPEYGTFAATIRHADTDVPIVEFRQPWQFNSEAWKEAFLSEALAAYRTDSRGRSPQCPR
ncbi:MAG: hypothetical protein ACRDXX_07170 [Stackebrandtia sp.]